MRLYNLHLVNFRNYSNESFAPDHGTNLIIGANGKGKTNLMEAVSLLSVGRSFRTNNIAEVIQFKKTSAYLKGTMEVNGYEELLEIDIRRRNRHLSKNNNPMKSIKEYRQEKITVVFQPMDLNMIRQSPSLRRNYLDEMLKGISPAYEENLRRYNKVLYQRNYTLKRLKYDKSLIQVYNVHLAALGARIIYERLKYIKKISQWTKEAYREISNQSEDLEVTYLSTLPFYKDFDVLQQAYLDLLEQNLPEDLEKGRTTIGPHLDDLRFTLDGKNAKNFASQGQQRSIVLALKFSEVKLIREVLGINPIVLLDDVFSELDKVRRRMLMNYIEGMQVFISYAESIDRDLFKDAKYFYIEDNRIIEK